MAKLSNNIPADVVATRNTLNEGGDVEFININSTTLAGKAGHLARFNKILSDIEDFRANFEKALRAANRVPKGHTVGFTKSKRGWLVIVGPELARRGTSDKMDGIDDVK